MMERIKQIWKQLEENNSTIAGLFKVRYSDESQCDVFLGLKWPEMQRTLIIRAPFALGKEFKLKYDFRGLRFDKIHDPDDSGFILLNLILVDRQLKDVFDTLVNDILEAVLNETDIKVILKNYSNRLLKWQNLFERFKQQGLSPEEQRGLFGELYFLRKLLEVNTDFRNVVFSWTGPENQIRDFQFGRWSVEVKTTIGNNHQKVQISSERQLDITNLDYLFLNHISLEMRQHDGETLIQLIHSITELLNSDYNSLDQFRKKLIEAGYFDQHNQLYSETGYFVRHMDYYKIENQFPRIEESDIRNGVGDVKYSIIMSQCNEFKISEATALNTLIFI